MQSSNRRIFPGAADAVLSQARMKAASDQVRLGIIGAERWGRSLLRTSAETKNTKVTHFCDVKQARLERAQQLALKSGFQNVKGSADMRRVLEDPNVDAVLIAMPDHWHAPAALPACQAAKDVYLEKPVSHNLREGRRKRPDCDIEDGHFSSLHCHPGNIVARTGRSIGFDAATETIPGDAEAQRLTRREYRNHWGKPKGI